MSKVAHDLRPAARQLMQALDLHRSMLTQSMLLRQREALNDDLLKDAAGMDGVVGRAAAKYLAARKELNDAVVQQRVEAERALNDLAFPFLTTLFGAAVPGNVTLPSDTGRGKFTECVTALEGLTVRGDEISGVVRTTSHGGRCGDSRSFFTRGSTVYFCDHVSL